MVRPLIAASFGLVLAAPAAAQAIEGVWIHGATWQRLRDLLDLASDLDTEFTRLVAEAIRLWPDPRDHPSPLVSSRGPA